MRRLRGWALLSAALCAIGAPLDAAEKAPAASVRAGTPYALPQGRFTVKVPAGWSPSRDEREDERQKVYGVELSGPRSADGVLSTISIAFYPPGNALFKGGSEEFMQRNLGGDPRIVPPAGETTSPVEKTSVGGLPARKFTRRSHEYLPPDRTDSKEVAVVETIEVADAKAGFYVLEFKSSEQLAAKLKPVYERVRAGVRFTGAR